MIMLENGVKPLRLVIRDKDGIVLATWRNEYVVWHISQKDDTSYCCAWGSYFQDLNDAVPLFNHKAAQFLGITS